MTRPAAGGRPRGLLLVSLALASLILPWGAAPSARGADGDQGSVRLVIDSLSPLVATAGSELRVSGHVENGGKQDLRDVEVRLRLSDTRLNSRTELDAVARGTTTGRDGSVVVSGGLDDLEAGRTVSFDLARPVGDIPSLTEFGVYALAVDVLATRSSGTGQVAIQRTLLPWTPADAGVRPTGFTWLWPLVSRPVRLADGSFADDSLAAEMAAGGRLDRLVEAGARLDDGAAVTWVVDPELLATAEDMADGYEVRGPDGSSRVAGGGSALAAGWLARLRSATADRQVLALPAGDQDITAVSRAGLDGDLPAALALSREVVARVLPAAVEVADTAWPVDGYVNRTTLAALRRSDASTVVLDGRAVPAEGDLSYTPSGRADLASRSGPVDAVLADPTLADLLRNRGDDPLLGAQRLLAETAMITSELPSGGAARTIVLMPPRRWAPDTAYLDRLAQMATQAPWMDPVPLGQLARSDPPEAGRRRLIYPAEQRRQELPPAYVDALAGMHSSINVFSAVLTDPDQLVPQLRRSVLLLESSWWRGRQARGDRLARERGYLADTRGLVRIQPANFTFSSRSGTIPLTVANGLAQEVLVGVRLEPQTPRLRVADIEPQVIGPQTKVQIEVPASAVAGGPVVVEASLRTAAGGRYGQPEQLRITITQYGTVALYITVAAAAVLFVAAGVRVARRLVGAGRREVDGTDLHDPDADRAAEATDGMAPDPEPTTTAEGAS